MTAPVYNLSRLYVAYISDDTNTYTKGTSVDVANAQTSPASPIDPASHPAYPRGWKPRVVYGTFVSGSVKYRTKTMIVSPSDPIWVGGTATIVRGDQTFDINGRRGEDRFYKGG